MKNRAAQEMIAAQFNVHPEEVHVTFESCVNHVYTFNYRVTEELNYYKGRLEVKNVIEEPAHMRNN